MLSSLQINTYTEREARLAISLVQTIIPDAEGMVEDWTGADHDLLPGVIIFISVTTEDGKKDDEITLEQFEAIAALVQKNIPTASLTANNHEYGEKIVIDGRWKLCSEDYHWMMVRKEVEEIEDLLDDEEVPDAAKAYRVAQLTDDNERAIQILTLGPQERWKIIKDCISENQRKAVGNALETRVKLNCDLHTKELAEEIFEQAVEAYLRNTKYPELFRLKEF